MEKDMIIEVKDCQGRVLFVLAVTTANEKPTTEQPLPQQKDVADDKMSVAQRRYLFRILAGRGVEGQAAHEQLKKLFGVKVLKEVSKEEASRKIDELLKLS